MRFVCLAPDCDFTATVVYDAAAHSYAYGTDHTTTDGAPMTTYTATIRFETEIADGTAYRCMEDGIAEHFGNVIGTFDADEVDGSFKLVEGKGVLLDEPTVADVVEALKAYGGFLSGPEAEHFTALAELIGGGA